MSLPFSFPSRILIRNILYFLTLCYARKRLICIFLLFPFFLCSILECFWQGGLPSNHIILSLALSSLLCNFSMTVSIFNYQIFHSFKSFALRPPFYTQSRKLLACVSTLRSLLLCSLSPVESTLGKMKWLSVITDLSLSLDSETRNWLGNLSYQLNRNACLLMFKPDFFTSTPLSCGQFVQIGRNPSREKQNCAIDPFSFRRLLNDWILV